MSLHERIAAELDRREDIAKAAAGGGTWRYAPGDSIGAWTLYDQHWNIASLTTYATETFDYANRLPAYRNPSYIDQDAIGRHMEVHDPADALRRYAAARRVLERHEPEDAGPAIRLLVCRTCSDLDQRTQRIVGYPCWEIRDLAASFGLEVDD